MKASILTILRLYLYKIIILIYLIYDTIQKYYEKYIFV